MIFERKLYIDRLVRSRNNGRIKIVTGMRRCGKSFLLFELFKKWLLDNGVDGGHIIEIDLENRKNRKLRDPDCLMEHIDSRLTDNDMHYILIDEIQLVDEFEDVLNSYLKVGNADVYVTGSNARFLSRDVITEFRGRGQEIEVMPLSFSEYYEAMGNGNWRAALDDYSRYGGMPAAVLESDLGERTKYLKGLFRSTYIKDIVQRNNIHNELALSGILDVISSGMVVSQMQRGLLIHCKAPAKPR